MMLSDSYTAKEIAPLVNLSERAVQYRARREGWTSRPREGRGGGSVWLLSSMPRETRDLIASNILLTVREAAPTQALVPTIAHTAAPVLCPAPVPTPAQNQALAPRPAMARATDRERRVAMARLAFVREVEALAAVVGKEGAVQHILKAAQSGDLSPALAAHLAAANACRRDGQAFSLSRRSLYRWCTDFANGGEAALLPGTRQKDPAPAWAAIFFKHYAKPQKPTVALAYKDFAAELAAAGMVDIPSIHACRRVIAKMSLPEREAGRATGNALLKLRPHKRRSTLELWPADVYTADGTTFDAEILHPYNGQPFKPEITAVLDVATQVLWT